MPHQGRRQLNCAGPAAKGGASECHTSAFRCLLFPEKSATPSWSGGTGAGARVAWPAHNGIDARCWSYVMQPGMASRIRATRI